MKKKSLLLLFLIWSTGAYSQNLVLDFSKKVTESCPSASRNLSKKLLIQTIKSNGHLNCQDEVIQSRFFKKCLGSFTCKQSNSLYLDIKTKYSGNVIGGE